MTLVENRPVGVSGKESFNIIKEAKVVNPEGADTAFL
jgi:hypothetical protein